MNLNHKLESILKILNESKKTHLTIAEEMLKAHENAIYPLDLLAIAVFKRSLSLIRGFVTLIESENYVCAVPLIRLQMDNLLRFYASFIVENPHQFAIDVLDGKHIRNLKAKDGNKMTDRYLVNKLNEEYKWIKEIYEKASGYIHLSNQHIFDSFKQNENRSELKLSIIITDKDEGIDEQTKVDAVNTMCHITNELLRFLHGWAWSKDNPDKLKK